MVIGQRQTRRQAGKESSKQSGLKTGRGMEGWRRRGGGKEEEK